jgi:CheY-like chemotaxis protein
MENMKRLVLVVEDDAEIRQMVCMLLRLNGYVTSEAIDGLDALDKVKDQVPDIMVLDIMMPNMDGLTLLKRLRREPKTKQLPVIVLSGKTEPEAIEEGFRAGANDYLTKPDGINILAQTMHKLLAESQSSPLRSSLR